MEPMRVLLVDDHVLFRKGLMALLISQDDFGVVGEAENGLEALEQARKWMPDLILMDIAIDIKGDVHPAYQLRRYAWSAKLPLSILTDFEEFAVYDCRPKPTKTDRPATARTIYLTYTDYPTRWDEIAGIHQMVTPVARTLYSHGQQAEATLPQARTVLKLQLGQQWKGSITSTSARLGSSNGALRIACIKPWSLNHYDCLYSGN